MRKQKNRNPLHSVLIGNIFTFIACSPFYFNGIINKVDYWSLICFLGVFQLGVSYIIYSIAIRYVTALDAIIYPVIEPIFNPVLAYFIIGETMPINSIIGGIFVLAGVTGRDFFRDKL
jgi:drug/metabolite transporter (DMT)-like permease